MKTETTSHGGHSHSKHRRGHTFFAIGASIWLAASVLVSLPPPTAFAVATSDIFTLSNNERSANGLAVFTPSAQLNAAAQGKAQHMRDNSYFAHDAPDGTTGWDFIAGQGYGYITAGENLAAGNQGASAVVQGWMNSPGHRANLLNGTFTEVGYGVTYVGNWEYNGVVYSDSYYIVALYAQPTTVAQSQSTPEPEPAPIQSSSQPPPTSTPQTQPEPEPEPEVVDEEPEEITEVVLTQEQELSEATPGVASVAEANNGAISPSLVILMMMLGSGAIVFGAWQELKWLKNHSHVHLHKN